MLYGLRESLAMLAEEGLENVFQRHTTSPPACAPPCSRDGSSSCARPRRSGTPTPCPPSWCPTASTEPTSSRAPSSATTLRSAPGCPRSPANCSASVTWAISTNSCCSARIAGAEMAMLDVGVETRARQRRGCGAELLAQPSAGRRSDDLRRRKPASPHDAAGRVPGPRLAQGEGAQALRLPPNTSSTKRPPSAEIVPRLRGRQRRHHQQGADAGRDVAATAAAQDDRGGGHRLRRGGRCLLQGARHRRGEHPQLRGAYGARTCLRDDPGAAPQSARLPAGRRKRRMEQIRAILLFHA